MHSDAAASFLRAVLEASWQGSLVMLLILALRPLLGIRVPSRWRCILWTFVLVRLLVPAFILPRSPASLQNISIIERPGERVAIALDAAYTNYLAGTRPASEAAGSQVSVAPAAGRQAGNSVDLKKIPWWRIGAITWALGAAALAAWIFGGNLRLQRRIRRDKGALDDSVAAIWDSCCQRFSVPHPPRLLLASRVDSPALVGVVRPVVLIPAKGIGAFSREDWEHIFMHELAHYRRRDHWTHAIQLLALCAH